MTRQWKDAATKVLHKKGNGTECGNYRSVYFRGIRRQSTA